MFLFLFLSVFHLALAQLLVNNAGLSGATLGSFVNPPTVDGLEVIFQSNYLSHFLLTILLMGTMLL